MSSPVRVASSSSVIRLPTSPGTDSSRPNETGDGGGGLVDLVGCVPAATADGVGDAVAQVIIQELERDGLQRLGHRGDLREDVDAVAVLLDHALKATHLSLDPPQTLLHGFFVVGVTNHGGHYTLVGYSDK